MLQTMNNIILKSKWMSVLVILLLMFPFQVFSTSNEQQQNQVSRTVTLVVSGEGTTKEEATNNALRSAIEQTFGTFVSANTEVLNDEIIKDQIATVSSGNIESYKVLSSVNAGSMKRVNIQAIVSIGKLISFAKSHGMKAELSGATFAMNMKLRQLNTKNEKIAIDNMFNQLNLMAENTNLYDYKIETGEPYQNENNKYVVPITILYKINQNGVELYKFCIETLESLSLSETEKKEYEKWYKYLTYEGLFYLRNAINNNKSITVDRTVYHSIWQQTEDFSNCFQFLLLKSLSKFRIVDNLNNIVYIGVIETDNLRNKYGTDIEILRCDDYYEYYTRNKEELISYSLACASKELGCIRAGLVYSIFGAGAIKYDSAMNDVLNKYGKMKMNLIYSEEKFMKLSSINVVPASKVIYFE